MAKNIGQICYTLGEIITITTLKNKKYTDENMLSDKFINGALQLFIRFLKEENIIEVFKKNYLMYLKHYNKQRYVKYNNAYNSYLLDIAHRNYHLEEERIYHLFLDNAMEWSKTEKGFHFWANVNRKWEEYFFNNLSLIKKRNK